MTVSLNIAYSQLTFSPSSVQVAQGNTVTFLTGNTTLAAGGSSWSWRLDGNVISGQAGSTLNLDTTGLQIGGHNIDVYVLWQSVLYSANLALTVTN